MRGIMLSSFVLLILASVTSESDITNVTDPSSSGASALFRPVVIFTPPWRHIKSGHTVTITCDMGMAAQENETFSWYRNEKLIDVHQQNFTIQSASMEEDNGEYQCRSNTSHISDPLWLHVTNDAVILQKPPKIYEGDPLTLRCYSSKYWTRPEFYKDGEKLPFSGSELHFQKVDRKTSGDYRCEKTQYNARHRIYWGWGSAAFVYVGGDSVKPLVTFTPNWRTIQEHGSVTLTCNVASAAQEKETFYWYRNNERTIANQQTFTIRSAKQRENSGYYQCRTSTSDISEPVRLDVEEADLVLQRPPSVYEGDPLTLRCYTMYGFRSANTTFFKDDKEIFFSTSDAELRIDKVDRSVTGTYRCTRRLQSTLSFDGTTKPFRTETAESHIAVRAVARPVVTLTPNLKNMLSGDSVTLTCEVRSTEHGNQTYYWYKDHSVLNITQREFTIPSASWRDSGEYKCRTRSSDMSYPASLEISGGPTSETYTARTARTSRASRTSGFTSPMQTSRTRGTTSSAQTSSPRISGKWSLSPVLVGILIGLLAQLILASVFLIYRKARRTKRYQSRNNAATADLLQDENGTLNKATSNTRL